MKISVFYSNVSDAARKSGISTEEALRQLKEAGITCLDFDYRDISEKTAAADFSVNSIYAFFDFTADGAVSRAKKVIDLAERTGAAAMFVPEKLADDEIHGLKEKQDRESVFKWLDGNEAAVKTAEGLEQLSLYGAEKDVPVCVENFDSHRSLTERKSELEWLFEKAPHLNFNLDTGNSVTCGENIEDLFSAFRDRIVNVHCKERREDNSTAAAGAGVMPIKAIQNQLIETGYNGGFSIEVFGVKDALSAIIKSAEYLLKQN